MTNEKAATKTHAPSLGLDFRPDWTQSWTAAAAEEQLRGFKFKGPGWYLEGNDAILVVPWERPPGEGFTHKPEQRDEMFQFCVWNGRDKESMVKHLTSLFALIVHAPIRGPADDNGVCPPDCEFYTLDVCIVHRRRETGRRK